MDVVRGESRAVKKKTNQPTNQRKAESKKMVMVKATEY